MWKKLLVQMAVLVLGSVPVLGQIRRNPTGVNVNASGATTVFITFGNLREQVPVEAIWCGELISAAPDIGMKCQPGTIFGSLPIRFDQSRASGNTGFTDIMSIPPSVARRAYQAAQRGDASSFFYVRRFASLVGGPDEYVFVTCRMASGGARVPLALLNVRMSFENESLILSVSPGDRPPKVSAEISYNGTGRLKGRWEVVLPGDEPPTEQDLLSEAALPVELRGLQRRYTELKRFNVFLPPTGEVTLEGPDPGALPTGAEGPYLILLRIEPSEDKEGDSNLGAAGAGEGIVRTGGVAGFPIPPLRYYVGTAEPVGLAGKSTSLLLPGDQAVSRPGQPIVLTWKELAGPTLYRIEIEELGGEMLVAAVMKPGGARYQAPTFIWEKSPSGLLRWRVVAIGMSGEVLHATEWRSLKLER